MSGETLLIILLVGLIAGWLAGQIVQGTGFGLIAEIAIGVMGALIGSWLLPHLGIHLGSGIVPVIISHHWCHSLAFDSQAGLSSRSLVIMEGRYGCR